MGTTESGNEGKQSIKKSLQPTALFSLQKIKTKDQIDVSTQGWRSSCLTDGWVSKTKLWLCTSHARNSKSGKNNNFIQADCLPYSITLRPYKGLGKKIGVEVWRQQFLFYRKYYFIIRVTAVAPSWRSPPRPAWKIPSPCTSWPWSTSTTWVKQRRKVDVSFFIFCKQTFPYVLLFPAWNSGKGFCSWFFGGGGGKEAFNIGVSVAHFFDWINVNEQLSKPIGQCCSSNFFFAFRMRQDLIWNLSLLILLQEWQESTTLTQEFISSLSKSW